VQVLKLCKKAGLVKLGHVALDGTKMKANASKHKAMSYERMQKEEAHLKEKVKTLLAQAESEDAQEDARYGKGRRGDELPEELRRSASRLLRIRAAKEALETEAKEASKRDDDDDESPPTDLPSHQVPHTKEGVPTPKAQRNFTDAESRIMKQGNTYLQGFNAQAAVDADSQVIVAQALTNQPPDVEHLPALVDRIAEHLEELPRKLSADAGYFSEENVRWTESVGVEPFIATGRGKHGEKPPSVRGRPPLGLTPKERMARKLATHKGKEVYRMRKAIVEPVFGQIKEARGIRALLRRGIEAAPQEWALICATHNLLKLHAGAAP
jgi:hypothetical protein